MCGVCSLLFGCQNKIESMNHVTVENSKIKQGQKNNEYEHCEKNK